MKKGPSDKIDVTKTHSFFSRELQLITVLLLIRHSCMSRSTRITSLKECAGFFNFNSILF